MGNTGKIYCRLSRDKQDQTSLADQEKKGRQYLNTIGVEDEHITVFVEDPGTSGFKEDVPLPERDKFIEYPADIAVVWMHDRLSRRGIEDSFRIKRLFEETGTRYVALADGIDTALEGSDLNLAMRALMANQYSRTLSKNVMRGKETGAANGNWSGGPRWYGYAVDVDGVWRGPKQIDQDQAGVLCEIRNRYIAGEALATIVRDINSRGLYNVGGTPWQQSNLLRVLLNPRNAGIRMHKGQRYQGNWPAIFTLAEHEELLAANTSPERLAKWPKRPGGNRRYLLTGFAECGNCGGKIRGNARIRKDKNERRYVCHDCHKVYRLADPVEYLVVESVLYRLDTPELSTLLTQSEAPGEVIAQLTVDIQGKSRFIQQLVDDYAEQLLDRAQFARAKATAEAALRGLESRLQREMVKHTGLTIKAGERLREWLESADLAQRRRLLALVVEKVIIHPNPARGGRLEENLWNGWRFDPTKVEIIWTDHQ